MRHGEIASRNGMLAQWFGAHSSEDRPGIRLEWWLTTDVPAADWPEAIGQVPWSPDGGPLTRGTVRVGHAGEAIWDVSHLRVTRAEVPLPAPPAGRTFIWQWEPSSLEANRTGSPWVKRLYPHCRSCQKRHDPDWADCPHCGTCHKPGRKCPV